MRRHSEGSDGRLRTNHGFYFCRDAAHGGALNRSSAAPGVLFVLKTPFFTKKIQKREILAF